MQPMKTFLFATVTALALTLIAALPIAVQADGGDTSLIHACVAKDGTMKIVGANTTCKGNETPLHWVNVTRVSAIETKNTTQDGQIATAQSTNTTQNTAISALQAKDSSQDTAIAAAGGGSNGIVIIKDSLGQVIGKNIDGQFVLRMVGNNPLQLEVQGAGFVQRGVQLLYTTTDCTGTPYYFAFTTSGTLFNFVQTLDGQTGYYTDIGTQNVTIRSFGNLPDPPASCQPADIGDAPVASVLTIDLTVFVPPFHAE